MAVIDRREGIDSTPTTQDRRSGETEGLGIKRAVRAATTAAGGNITLSGEQTIDGVAIVDGDRVLVKNQTAASQNGIYIASTGNWERAKDANGNNDLETGTIVFVISGTANSETLYYLSTTGDITIDTTSLTFTEFIGADLSAIEDLTGAGILRRTGTNTWALITDGAAKSVLQGSGAAPSFTTTPTVEGLTISANAASLPAAVAGAILQLGAADGTSTVIQVDSFGTGLASTLVLRGARGTAALPTATQSGDTLGNISYRGYGATGYSSSGRAAVTGFAAENWTDSAQGAYLSLGTTPTGSATRVERVRVGPDGVLTVSQNATAIDSLASPNAGAVARFVAPDATSAIIEFDSYGANSVLTSRRAQGTGALPTVVTSGLSLSTWNIYGYDGSAFSLGGSLGFSTNELWSGTARGTSFAIAVTAPTTTTLRTVLSGAATSTVATATIGVAGTTRGALVLTGNTSGSLNLTVPAAAGSNTLTFPAGTTDFSATGGTSQVVWQTSAGGAFTVARPAVTDLAATTANRLFGTDGSGVSGLITLPAAGITLSAGAIALANDLSALEGLGSTGFAVRSATDTWVQRSIAGTASQITATNGDGVSGNPTLSFPADVLIPTVLTVPNTGLHLLDTDATHDLIIKPGSNLTADRTFTITTGDADRTLSLAGDLTTAGAASLPAIAQGDLWYGSASGVISALAKDTNATRYLANTGTTNNPAWAQINLANGVSGDLPFANLTQIAGLSVLGVTGSSTADVAAITGADGQVLRVSGTTLGFGTIATAGHADDSVTFAKMQNIATARLLGRGTASTGDIEELTIPTGLSLSAGALSLANDLSALEALSSTGIAVRSATDTWVQRSVAGTANEITATNGDGVSGNPTLSLPAALTFTGKTVTGGTFSASVLSACTVTTSLVPTSDDGAALGSTGNKFSDLFLASGAVINFSAGDVTLTHASNSLTMDGGDLTLSNVRLVMSGTMTSASLFDLTTTVNSTGTGNQQGIRANVTFNPAGASLSAARGVQAQPTISASATINITTFAASYFGLITASGYSGIITSAYGVEVANPSIGAGNTPFSNYFAFSSDTITHADGQTSGTFNNYGFFINPITSSAAGAATINNYAAVFSVPSGSGAGTTVNKGLVLTGNGGSGGGGTTTNYAIFSDSTALSQFTGGIRSIGATAGIGYGTGSGGTVTQATSKSTGVTLNTVSGAITMNNAALAAGTIVSFVLTNSAIAATDVLILNHISGGTPGSYTLNARAGSGSATIDVRNNTAGSLSEAVVIEFAIIKAVTA